MQELPLKVIPGSDAPRSQPLKPFKRDPLEGADEQPCCHRFIVRYRTHQGLEMVDLLACELGSVKRMKGRDLKPFWIGFGVPLHRGMASLSQLSVFLAGQRRSLSTAPILQAS